jgi:hypothetical protein
LNLLIATGVLLVGMPGSLDLLGGELDSPAAPHAVAPREGGGRKDGLGVASANASGPDRFLATVLTPDGRPAAKAKVAIGLAGSQILIKNGDIDDQSKCARRQTDTAGRFHFPLPPANSWLVITHPAGYARLKCSPKSPPDIIQLTRWARVEGTLRVGRKLLRNEKVHIILDADAWLAPPDPLIFANDVQSTDSNGRFVFERVIAGEGRIGRLSVSLSNSSRGATSSTMLRARFVSGNSTHIDLGTSGRPVIGQLKPASDARPDLPWKFALIVVRVDDRQVSESSPHFTAMPDSDGNFCIDDVPPGKYWLSVHFVGQGADQPTAARRFSVPSITEKLSQRPVDLGVLTLTREP